MPSMLQPGDKVKYLYGGEWRKGVVHGVKTHEDSSGIISRVAYLIDTGKNVREDVGHEPTGKMLHNVFTKKNDIPELKEVAVRQPEQVELPQEFVKPL